MAIFAQRLIDGALDDSTLEVNNEVGRVKDAGITPAKLRQDVRNVESTDTGAAGTYYPNSMVGCTVNTETMADTDNDDVVLGQVCVATGNVVEGIIGDVGSATVGRKTCVVNRSGGTLLITVADETNTKINELGKRLSIADRGYCVLMEAANDKLTVIDAAGVSLVAFA